MPNGPSLPGVGPGQPLRGARWALALLLAINLFNYIDRQILAATLPKIKDDTRIFAPDADYVDAQLGFLTTAFMVSYMCLSPVFGRLGDTLPRWGIIGIAVIIWSLATGGTGLATSYLILFLTRCFVGIGEAAYGPVAPAMLSDLYPVDHRGRIMAWFYMAIPVGSALGFVIGSLVAGTALGWRGAFMVAVIPGIALGILCFFMKEVPRFQAASISGPEATNEKPHSPGYWAVLKHLKGNRSFVLCCAGMTASTFVLGGVGSVMQLYLFEREARFTLSKESIEKLKKLQRPDDSPKVPESVMAKLKAAESPDVLTIHEFKDRLQGTETVPGVLNEEEFKQYSADVINASPAPGSPTNESIGPILGVIVVISGLVATLLGGMAGDYLRNRGVKGAYFHVSGWGMIVGFPFFVGMLYTTLPVSWLLLFVAVFFLFFNTGPANTILANVTRSTIRATAFAINILVIHAFGDAISPPIIGLIGRWTSLQVAFLCVSFMIPLSGILWIWGARYLDEDTRKVDEFESAVKSPTSANSTPQARS